MFQVFDGVLQLPYVNICYISSHSDLVNHPFKGRVESKRWCVYLSGVEAEQTIKLLGIPECSSGKGMDKYELVREYLVKWSIREHVIGMVFDNTNSNSGEHSGACRYLEILFNSPVLWLACRHHIAELQMVAANKEICSDTKEPGVSLLRRLRNIWYSLEPAWRTCRCSTSLPGPWSCKRRPRVFWSGPRTSSSRAPSPAPTTGSYLSLSPWGGEG